MEPGRGSSTPGGTPGAGSKPLRSDFAGDPDMQEILDLFVQEMPSRVGELLGSLEKGELERLGRVAHQLKGAGGGYGFNVISDVAGALEKSVHTLRAQPTEELSKTVKSQVDALVELCRRATSK
jgi:HPt (histidine-containing phosphotransfer) domain-containing protein